jgi:putative transposase
MPRANRYYLPGNTYHLTHRCHNRQFLLRFAVDRDAYRRILWETKPRDLVRVLSYSLTCNHVHLLALAEDDRGISTWMQRAEGEFAQWYNRRKGRCGAFWQDRYHATQIEGPQHSERCMTYIELNMVRAGVVSHPRQWRWCSYQEWMGVRKRYCLVDIERALEFFGGHPLQAYRDHYEDRIRDRIARDEMAREPCWTESIAVGSAEFVGQVEAQTSWRRRFEREEITPGAWALREESKPWLGGEKGP